MKYSFSYLICLEFLGFRFSGWQKQTNAKTLHDMVDKSLSYVFEDALFKTIGVGRTDAKVSANSYYLQLFRDTEIDEALFINSLNFLFVTTVTSIKNPSILTLWRGFSCCIAY